MLDARLLLTAVMAVLGNPPALFANPAMIDAPPASSFPQASPSPAAGPDPVDVVVYGSTPGGFCAAIAAAREGASVLLLEPTAHVGGLSTGGLSHCDSNQMDRSTVMGLFHEWHTRIVQDYVGRGLDAPYDPASKDQARWTFEPHVALRVTMQMLAEAGVEVRTGQPLRSLTKDGPRITSLTTGEETFRARVFVDGSYEGDLMAAAGVDWVIGREGQSRYGESLAGRRYPKQRMDIDGFADDGQPLPLITAVQAGEEAGGAASDEAAGDEAIMTYSFRLCLTAAPVKRLPMPRPAHYDPWRFEVVRRYLEAGGDPGQVGFDTYPLPDGKFDGNNSIGRQFSIGLVGGEGGWHAADAEGRRAILEAHRQYTLEFYRFLTTDPAVPETIRARYARLGLCRDEFVDHGHFPPALYVRESRRLRGIFVISQKDILEEREKADPIAISSFPIDSHDCRRVALEDGGVINEGTIFPVRRKEPKQGYPYHVPYRALLPRTEQCDNLLVPVALSCTHVGMSSLRIEGTWMVIGQSAGIAAALSAREDVAVQRLAYGALRARLLAQGQVLELPADPDPPAKPPGAVDPQSLPGIVLDDTAAELEGEWKHSSLFAPHVGPGYVHDDRRADGLSRATFRFTAPEPGLYELRMAYSAHETRAAKVPMVVQSGDHRTELTVDQQIDMAAGECFRTIGKVRLTAGVESTLVLHNTGTDGFVILDAFQLVPSSGDDES